jgi:phosphate-selective porin O/P
MPVRTLAVGLCAVLLLLAGATRAGAQIVVTAGEDVHFKLGILGQFQGDTVDDPETSANADNLFVRRLRLMFGGQVMKNVTFFVETGTPNLGRTLANDKNIQPAVIIQDAYAEFKAFNAFSVDAGLMFVPFSRNFLQSAASLLPIDYGAYTYSQSGPTESSTGRDTGFQARGYFLKDRLEYRIGAFQGSSDGTSHRAYRYAGRAQFNLFDTEVGFFYTGTYLGKKKIVAIGGAFDTQSDYRAYAADVFVDYPLASGAFTGQVGYNRFDGGTTLRNLPRQNDVLLELGYLLGVVKLTPFVQFTSRNVVNTRTGDETRTSVGASYWLTGHNATVKAAYGRIAPSGASARHEFTIQLQVFYF